MNDTNSKIAVLAGKYASGEVPMKGDTIKDAENLKPIYLQSKHPEVDETWIVTSITDDMVRAKCERAPNWRQAFYTSKMLLCKRKDGKRIAVMSQGREGKVSDV